MCCFLDWFAVAACLASLFCYLLTPVQIHTEPFKKLINALDLSPLFLLISNLINKLLLHQFLGTKTIETNNLLTTDANKAY